MNGLNETIRPWLATEVLLDDFPSAFSVDDGTLGAVFSSIVYPHIVTRTLDEVQWAVTRHAPHPVHFLLGVTRPELTGLVLEPLEVTGLQP